MIQINRKHAELISPLDALIGGVHCIPEGRSVGQIGQRIVAGASIRPLVLPKPVGLRISDLGMAGSPPSSCSG
jgi:hypothetical protein